MKATGSAGGLGFAPRRTPLDIRELKLETNFPISE